jgi:hypothetical protein
MKTATSLALVAIGAIFAFAITRSPAFLNLQVVGWVLMLTGGVGALVPRRGNGWLRRSLVVRNDETEQARDGKTIPLTARPQQTRYSRLLMPAGVLTSRRRPVQSAGQVQHETIEEYVEE